VPIDNPHANLRSLRVLIVDDSSFTRKLQRSMLRQIGILDISEASDGLEAMGRLAHRDRDIVLLDWHMQNFSGAEFLQVARDKDDDYFRTLPVIIVTGFANEALVVSAKKLGANAVIAKPFSLSLLRTRIDLVLGLQTRVIAPMVDPEPVPLPAPEPNDGYDEQAFL